MRLVFVIFSDHCFRYYIKIPLKLYLINIYVRKENKQADLFFLYGLMELPKKSDPFGPLPTKHFINFLYYTFFTFLAQILIKRFKTSNFE